VHFDGFVDDVRCDDFFTTFEYKVRTGHGATDRAMSKGAYLIIDPGYHKWAATQAASKISSDPDYVLWRTQMEAVRKDIECFFGRLKNRFRVLKTPLTFHKKRDIDNLVFTCIGLQNILHDWDKESGEITSWEVDADWLGAGGDFDDEAQTGEDDDEARHWCRPKLRRSMKNGATSRAGAKDDFSEFGSSSIPIGAERGLGSRHQASRACYPLQIRLVRAKRALASWLEPRDLSCVPLCLCHVICLCSSAGIFFFRFFGFPVSRSSYVSFKRLIKSPRATSTGIPRIPRGAPQGQAELGVPRMYPPS